MSKWMSGERWEWAIQWAHNEGGKWRLWDGSGWQNIVSLQPQSLAANTWHTLHLSGDTTNGQVHYINFIYDDSIAMPLGQTFPPISLSAPNELAVMVELDANEQGNSYQVYIDRVDFLWR